MITSTRRVRAEEKRLIKKAIVTVAGITGTGLFILFVGLPLFSRAVFIGRSTPQSSVQEEQTILFAPVFNPIPEATNSAKITISGHAQKNSTVVLTINNEPRDSLTVEDDGTFRAENIKLKEGNNEVSGITVQKDKESAASKTFRIVYKKGEPKLEIAAPGENERFSSSDQQNLGIRGETDPGNRVTINDRVAITDQNGKFTLNFRLSDGENTLKFMVTDSAGNQITKERKVHYSP